MVSIVLSITQKGKQKINWQLIWCSIVDDDGQNISETP